MVDARTEGGFGAKLKREGASSEKNRVVSVSQKNFRCRISSQNSGKRSSGPRGTPGDRDKREGLYRGVSRSPRTVGFSALVIISVPPPAAKPTRTRRGARRGRSAIPRSAS